MASTPPHQQTMPPLIMKLLLLSLLLAHPSAANTVSTASGGKSDKHQPQKQQQNRPYDPSWLETAITEQPQKQQPADRGLAPPLVNVRERGQAESTTAGAALAATEEQGAAMNPGGNANRPAAAAGAEAKNTDDRYGRKSSRQQGWEKIGSGQQQQQQQEQKWRKRQQQQKQKQKQQNRKQSPQVESVKTEIIGDFVREHGDAIRRSRRHADLFDGSGHLIDLMEELNEYESRADEHRQKERKRRSANGDREPPLSEEQTFASLSEALEHLNGGQQFEVASDGLNVRFEADVDFDDEDHSSDKVHSSEKLKRRSADKDEDDNDEGEAYDEAASSLERLDETLAELAHYLDELAADEAAASEEAGSSPLEQYRRSMSDAYGSLAQLRGVAQGLLSKRHQQQQQQPQQQQQHRQPPRMASLFLEKAADWQMDAEALTENVRQLERLYRQADEL